jgi:hypothetical protein
VCVLWVRGCVRGCGCDHWSLLLAATALVYLWRQCASRVSQRCELHVSKRSSSAPHLVAPRPTRVAARCAAAGLNGLVDAVEPGLACGSDTSHMNLLGYDPRQ